MSDTTLRVCHVMSADLWAGAEVQVATIASYLLEQPDVTMTAVLLNDGWLASELRRLGVQTTVFDERRQGAAALLRLITRFLKTHPADVVHTHRYKDTILGAIAAKLAGVPWVVRTVHGLPEPFTGWSRLKLGMYDIADKLALWCCADRIVAVSESIAAVLRRSAYRSSAIRTIHNGIDLRAVRATRTAMDVRRTLGFTSDEILIGTAGRLSAVKGQSDLVRAAALIREQEGRARFVFIGSGPLEAALVREARLLSVENECLFIDPQKDCRVGIYDLMAALDVFVLPSLSEGIPMALLEAMALGAPVVATAVGGVPEIVTHRESGLLVKARDARAIADASLELIRNRAYTQALTAQAKAVVAAEYSRETAGRALLNLYRHFVESKNAAGVRAPDLLVAPFAECLERVTRRIAHGAERRRMRRIRRNPAALVAALRDADRILIVCYGNIIRSAFAERLIKQAAGSRPSVSICSAGLAAVPGRPSHPTAIATAAALNVDLSRHAAAPVTAEAVSDADVIFVMDVAQVATLRERFPEACGKTFLLACLVPDGPLEIRDPIDGNQAVFRACFHNISRAAEPIIRALSETAS